MTHSAHPPLPPTQALARLQQAAGSRFDPKVVEALTDVLRRSGEVDEVASGRVECAVR